MSLAYVRSAELFCPLGRTGASACAAIRCGISVVEELPYEDDRGEPYYASVMPDLAPELTGRARVRALLEQVLHGALETLGSGSPVAVFLVLPGFAEADGRALLGSLVDELGASLRPGDSKLMCGGPVRAFQALGEVHEMLREGWPGACVVAAADSFVSPRRVLELQQVGRLRGLDEPDGVIPGEAAACLILDGSGQRALAGLRAPGFGREPATLWNDLPHRGDGLVEATTMALAGTGYDLADVDARVSDAAGESFDFREQALLVSRLLSRRKSNFPLLLPGGVLGEVGVAAPLCAVIKAVASYQRGYALGPRTLAFARDHSGPRGAIVVESLTEEPPP